MSAPSTRLLRKQGATVAVTANADVLFLPGGDVNRWTREFNETIKTRTKYYAPRNKRPRWAHYGAPLKQTFRTTEIQTRSTLSGMRLYAAVGSSAPYAAYVDQGTGVHGGNGPYKAKILPPWTVGSPSLYEAAWTPPGRGRPQGGIWIRGQIGQEFFDKGLRSAFRIMVRQGQNIPGAPGQMSQALRTWPRSLENFSGATPVTGRFIAQLNEWRRWRDEAFESGRLLGRDADVTSDGERARGPKASGSTTAKSREKADKATQRRVEAKRERDAKSTTKAPPKQSAKATAKAKAGTLAARREAALAEFKQRNPQFIITSVGNTGIKVNDIRGREIEIPWSVLYGLLP